MKKRVINRLIFISILLLLVIIPTKVNAAGLFNAKMGKGQIFDIQRMSIPGGYYLDVFDNPFDASISFSFGDADLIDRYFQFKIQDRATNKVALYIYNSDGTPASATDFINPSLIGSTGLVGVGKVFCAGSDGLLFISDMEYGDFGYFIANSLGFSNGDNFVLMCSSDPTIEDLEGTIWNDVPLLENQHAILYKENTTDSVSDMPSSQVKDKDININLSSLIPKRTGYDFLGWSSSPSGTVEYQPENSYTENDPLVLYAIWEKIEVQNNDTSEVNPQTNDINLVLITITTILAIVGFVYTGIKLKKQTIKI